MNLSDNNIETLKARVKNGQEYCNNQWQEAKQSIGDELYDTAMARLDNGAILLRELVASLNMLGYTDCPYGECKWNDDNFICLACGRANKS